MSATDLQEAFRALPPTVEKAPMAHTWKRYLWDIRRHVEKNNPEEFLNWSTIQATMFVGNGAGFTPIELKALKRRGWDRWKKAIRESHVGDPIRYNEPDDFTSGNLIHQAFHLLQWEKASGQKVEDLQRIVEFGGGYGALAAICRRLGFEGEYVIYDNREMSLIQQYYLSNLGYEAEFRITDNFQFNHPGDADLMVAAYSLSEVTDRLRDNWLGTTDADNYLFVHQDKYFGINLADMFNAFARTRPDKTWFMVTSPIRGHRYVIGLPNE